LTLAVAPPAWSQERLDVQLDAMARAWAHVNYEISDPRVEIQAAQKLEAEAEALARQNPSRAEPLAWQALALLCEADARHNLSSLELAG
jgi:hypothetical protein